MKLWAHKGMWASRGGRRKIQQLDRDAVERVAVIRHAALGDMVLTRPFLQEIRSFFPNATITLSVVSNYMFGVPEDLVDRVHVAYGSDKKDIPLKEQLARGRELGEHDIIFDAAATTRSSWLCFLNKARLKIGFPYHAIQRPLFYDAAVLRSDYVFEAEIMLHMLHMLGHRSSYPYRYDLGGDAMVRDRPYIVYFPSASVVTKIWPLDCFAELVACSMNQYPDYEHVVLKGLADWETIEPINQRLGDRDNYTPFDDFTQTEALVKGAALVVSNDTGIRNLAIAANVPTVGIFFSTLPYTYWPRYPIHEAVFRPDGSLPAVEEVFAAIESVIERGNST
jgi:ADP-heptose:LPS heptosyltransferase